MSSATLAERQTAALFGLGDELAITVSHEHIRQGIQNSPLSCAIAVAAFDVLDPEYQFAEMGSDGTLVVYTDPIGRDVYFSEQAGAWVERFDKRKDSVAPERFIFRRQAAANGGHG